MESKIKVEVNMGDLPWLLEIVRTFERQPIIVINLLDKTALPSLPIYHQFAAHVPPIFNF